VSASRRGYNGAGVSGWPRGCQSTTRKGVVVRVNDAWSMSYIAMDEICVKGDVNCHCNTKKWTLAKDRREIGERCSMESRLGVPHWEGGMSRKSASAASVGINKKRRRISDTFFLFHAPAMGQGKLRHRKGDNRCRSPCTSLLFLFLSSFLF
jgi:hypothetical protein